MLGGHNKATLRQTKMKQTDSNSPCSVDTTRPLSGRLKWSRQTPAVHVWWTQHGHSPPRKGGHVCPVFTVNHTSSSLLSHRLWYSSSIPLWGTAPPYLSELLHLHLPSRSLRSASDTRTFRVPGVDRRTLGERSFQYIGPVIWNSLSLSVRHSSSLSPFKLIQTLTFQFKFFFFKHPQLK